MRPRVSLGFDNRRQRVIPVSRNRGALERAGTAPPGGVANASLASAVAKRATPAGYALAGAVSGVMVSLCLHPIDTIKVVVQADRASLRPIAAVVRSFVAERGVLGLYSGLLANLATSAPISAIYTATYEGVKERLTSLLPPHLAWLINSVAGGAASVATSAVYCPSETVKQRLQVGTSGYKNAFDALAGIVRKEGAGRLYSGWGAVLLRNVPQSAAKFYLFEQFKAMACASLGAPPGTLHMLAIGGAANAGAALVTTPFDVVKTRLMTQSPASAVQYRGVMDAARHILKSEGAAGFYRGVGPRLVIYISQGAVFFATYELAKQFIEVAAHVPVEKRRRDSPDKTLEQESEA